jgi:regulator of sigma E protease
MDNQNTTSQQDLTSQTPAPKESGKKDAFFNGLLLLIIIAGVIFLAAQHPAATWKVVQVAVGFGAVIFIHELGHFLMAKLCGIKVEAFSIGFPPVLFSVRKLKSGLRVRFMPKTDVTEPQQEGDADTEYCVGIIPFGGFVKMLGQSDSGAVEKTDDPRSYLNKPIWQRVVVVAGGVVFNAIGAMILYMALFMHGLQLMPAVVGEVIPDSPADVAGLKAGDRIVEIEGETFIDFTTVILSAALSDKDRGVAMKIERSGSPAIDVRLAADKPVNDTSGIRVFGIAQPTTLKINPYVKEAEDIESLFKKSGFRPGDTLTAINGNPLTQPWQLEEVIASSLTATAKLTATRAYPAGSSTSVVDVEMPLFCAAQLPNFQNEFDLAHIYSIVPRLRALEIVEPMDKDGLKKGDILIQVGDVEHPTYKDLREQTEAHKDKKLSMTVLRQGADGQLAEHAIAVYPKARKGDNGRVTLGVIVELDMEHPVVACTADLTTGPSALPIPAGSVITAVDGESVNSFYDVVRLIRASSGQRVSIEYRHGQDAGGTALDVPQEDALHIRSSMLNPAPFESLRDMYRAGNPFEAIVWGVKRTKQYIMQSVMTLIGLFSGSVPGSSLSGPVGIATISYKMAGQGFLDLLNFLGLVGSCLVVMNLLPLPIVDGGVIVLLIIEKFRGAPLNQKIQEVITWVGLGLLLSVFVLVTYNDIVRVVFGQ